MRTHELAPPRFSPTNDTFSITFSQSTYYSAEQEQWLSQFEAFKLSREQKALLLLGISGREIAPQAIIDTLGIVDIEHYRQLVASLQGLGLLLTSTTKSRANKIARKKRVTVRQIPRFTVVIPNASAPIEPPSGGGIASSEGSYELFVANLPKASSVREIRQFLARSGTILSLKIPKGYYSVHRGYCFVRYSSDHEADGLRTTADSGGLDFHGFKIVVEKTRPSADDVVPPSG
jgi:ATP-dependent DNA helicase RecG